METFFVVGRVHYIKVRYMTFLEERKLVLLNKFIILFYGREKEELGNTWGEGETHKRKRW